MERCCVMDVVIEIQVPKSKNRLEIKHLFLAQ